MLKNVFGTNFTRFPIINTKMKFLKIWLYYFLKFMAKWFDTETHENQP